MGFRESAEKLQQQLHSLLRGLPAGEDAEAIVDGSYVYTVELVGQFLTALSQLRHVEFVERKN